MPNFQIIGFSTVSVFEMANFKLGRPAYELHVLSETGEAVRSSFGMQITTEPLTSDGFDTLILAATMSIPMASENMVDFLQKASTTTRRLASVCIAAFAFGEAGLLDGRRATTHWRFSQELRSRYPKCKVDMDRIYIADGNIWTSAGMSAGTDLALGMVESDHGHEFAREVAKGLVLHHRRSGGQSQHSTLLELDAKEDRIQTALAYAKRNLHLSLSIDDLARAANLSPRQFTRLFKSETGVSAAKAVEKLRLEAAKQLLEQGRLPIAVIARETGFGDSERMRRAFTRAFGSPPRMVRQNSDSALIT